MACVDRPLSGRKGFPGLTSSMYKINRKGVAGSLMQSFIIVAKDLLIDDKWYR